LENPGIEAIEHALGLAQQREGMDAVMSLIEAPRQFQHHAFVEVQSGRLDFLEFGSTVARIDQPQLADILANPDKLHIGAAKRAFAVVEQPIVGLVGPATHQAISNQ
jgi:hypothetical protein